MQSRVNTFKLISAKYLVALRVFTPVEKERKHLEDAAKRAYSGIFVETQESFPLDSLVEVELTMPGKAELFSVRGIVKLQNATSTIHRPKGLGIHLLEVFSKGKTCKYHLPEADMLAELLTGLVGKDAVVTRTERNPCVPGLTVLCTYTDQNDALGGVWLCDVPMATRAGGALSMIPPNGLIDALAQNELGENVAENFREIVNVAASLFNSTNTPHLKLKEMMIKPAEYPQDVQCLINYPGGRQDFKINITEYGEGSVTLICA